MTRRVRIAIRGAVQGVGFRPFVYRLASELRLAGWVLNSSQGVFIEAEAEKPQLDAFLIRLEKERPALSRIQSLEFSFLDAVGLSGFEIRASRTEGTKSVQVLPDIATCRDCLQEILDPAARRHRYPFTNCTHCGPRYTIIESLPYDRPNTSMKVFDMCPACREEYEDPRDRRFHAQPIACPGCGPQLELWDSEGRPVCAREQALVRAAGAVAAGMAVAVKGLGGFHLVADARSEEAVLRLRRRKLRMEKPLALMFPDLRSVREVCRVSDFEERLLLSPESPIVLLERRDGGRAGAGAVAEPVAPDNPYLGIMLPYTPLHHLLMCELQFPIVATSGNLSEEPICVDEREAAVRLRGIADLYLVHDRPIVRHVDDSIVRVVLGRELMLRRSRGYAPLPCGPPVGSPALLAVGGHLKNTVAMAGESGVILSQHIGDLETAPAFRAFRQVIDSLLSLFSADPEQVAVDLHPDYLSTRYALALNKPIVAVQHHHAHVVACMAENDLQGTVLGVSWDGTGYGPDHTVWGGEFLLADESSFRRAAHLRQFKLPGGDRAVREPRRSALGALYGIFGDALFERGDLAPVKSFDATELAVLRRMLARGLNCPLTSSAGRLFDAVASLLNLRQTTNFEGQAAMQLEFAAGADGGEAAPYPFHLRPSAADPPDRAAAVVDWAPMLKAIVRDCAAAVPVAGIAARFHRTLAEMVLAAARLAGQERVVLSGGCFQNRLLTEWAVRRLEQEGFRPYWHQRVPPNDGGIALGQAVVAARLRTGG